MRCPSGHRCRVRLYTTNEALGRPTTPLLRIRFSIPRSVFPVKKAKFYPWSTTSTLFCYRKSSGSNWCKHTTGQHHLRGILRQIAHRDFDPANADRHHLRLSLNRHGPLVSQICIRVSNIDAMAVSFASHLVQFPPTADQTGQGEAPSASFIPNSAAATEWTSESTATSSSKGSSKKWAPKVRTGCLTCR